MENTDFEKLFNHDFDIAEPSIGHFERFEKRLKKPTIKYNPKTWRWLVVAASIVFIFGFWIGLDKNDASLQLADISPKMEETQDYFSSVIRTEIAKVNTQKSSENTQLIDATFVRLENLEEQYKQLTLELKESGEDKRIVFAMISNFQQRIEILQDLLKHIEDIKQFKTTQNETYS